MQRFTLTPDHIKLLRAANVSWWGAPSIDPKRPFGNSDLYQDMMQILYGEAPSDDALYSEQLTEILDRTYRELKTALQIVLAAGTFEPGLYEADDYRSNWRRTP